MDKATLRPKDALRKAYKLFEPFSNKQRWEFDNELSHVEFITKNFSKDIEILDAGCGIGLFGVALSLLGYKVLGIDKYVFLEHSPSEIQALEKVWNDTGFSVINGDLLETAADTQYDLVTSIAVIEHQRYPKKFTESLLSYVKSGGYLYVATPNVLNGLNRFRVFFGRAPMGNVERFYLQGPDFYGHWREYALSELKKMCELSGLKVIKAQSVQASWPILRLNSPSSWYRGVFQLLAQIVPGWGDTIRVLAQKK